MIVDRARRNEERGWRRVVVIGIESVLRFLLVFLWVGVPFVAVAAITGWFEPAISLRVRFSPPPDAYSVHWSGGAAELSDFEATLTPEEVPAALERWSSLFVVLWLTALLVLLHALLRIVRSLRRGDPFDPANAGRMRAIALALVVLDVLDRAQHGLLSRRLLADLVIDGAAVRGPEQGRDLSDLLPWFVAALLLLLAEVFRRGAELHRESSLTV